MDKAKSFDISKQVVWDAYRRVRANRGAAGVDGESLAMFEKDLKGQLYKVWNRMSSGSYFPPPVRLVEIPKRGMGGGKRLLAGYSHCVGPRGADRGSDGPGARGGADVPCRLVWCPSGQVRARCGRSSPRAMLA